MVTLNLEAGILTTPLAYYNAGSAALVLLLIFLAIGVFFWCRIRSRRRTSQVRLEESIPLHTSMNDDEGFRQRAGKGKERALGDASEREEMFAVVDSDDEDEFKSLNHTR